MQKRVSKCHRLADFRLGLLRYESSDDPGSQQKKLVRYGVFEKGKSLYLPYAWCHAVLTLCDEERVCCMYYAEMQTRLSLVASAWKRCQQHCMVNKRRGPDDSESHDSE